MQPAAPDRIDLALAEGNPLVLQALSEVFEKDRRFSVVATSSTAEGFLGAVMRVPVKVGVIDWQIPQLGGQKLTEVLRDQEGAPRLVIYAEDPTGAVTLKAMAAGAAGFVDRKSPVDRLLETCVEVAAGKMVFPFVDVRGLQTDPIHQLTRREKALLEALANGLTNKDLAREFDISTNTVKYHLSNLFDKLGVASRTQAIAYYFKSR
ncbi:response regulator transcription factor [Tabrizicola oligotrophica]|uniref:Response regulator transcription factor n=1 Tax=Tabrizicola oligotrophica TaxID=2710650 RepID=A0A6M0QZC9_9RHOB|nr:response regulator transcription factor [Tabrizicola oligotrophica]NEY92204.1 response regulator transcription factor [Tabrizicola oligotrophica]